MMQSLTVTILALSTLRSSESFTQGARPTLHANKATKSAFGKHSTKTQGNSKLQLAEESDQTLKTQSQKLARLNAMAAKLRAEASTMEAEQQVVVNYQLAQTFATLDTNKDGSISLQELKDALATQLESVVSEEVALKIMKKFDTSGDGAIQLDEFKGIEAFRATLDKVVREEKQAGLDANAQALLAKQTAEVAAAKVLAVTDQVNSLPPTGSDKVLSLLPYLLPLCDALPYARAFIQGNALENNNPIFEFASFIFLLYQTIPFSGLVAFFLLSSFTSNLKLNRLVRFNIQQAIFLDIALIFPGIIGTIVFAVAKQGNFEVPLGLVDASSTATFLTASAAILYSMGSSLAGALPDKIPFVSDRVKLRVPTADDILKMLEDQENMLKMQEKDKKMNNKRRERGEKKEEEKKDEEK